MKKVYTQLSENIISLLYTIVTCEIIVYSVQRQFNLIYSIVVVALVILFYTLFEKIVELDKSGPLLYLVSATIVFAISIALIKLGEGSTYVTFYRWFLGGGVILDKVLTYELASVILIPFVFGSLSYYYSVTVIRIPMMFLISFIALILNIKGVYRVNNIAVFVFIILLFMLFIVSVKKKNRGKENIVNVKQIDLIPVAISFVLIIFTFSLFIPKPQKIPKIDGFEEVKNIVLGAVNKTERGAGNSKNMNQETNRSMEPLSDEIVYVFSGMNPGYLIERNFDDYEKNKWIQKDKELKTFKELSFDRYMTYKLAKDKKDFKKWEFEIANERYETLEDTLSIMRYTSNLKGDLASINKNKYSDIDNTEYTNYFAIQGSSNRTIVYPSKLTWFQLEKYGDVRMNGFYELDSEDKYLQRSEGRYETKSYTDESYPGSNKDIIMKYFNNERYIDFITENSTNEKLEEEKLKMEYREKKYKKLGKNVTKRMSDLAVSLTKDEESFYGKAKIIENYFTSGEYKYSLELENEEVKGEYMDYFIFEGKTGYCVQYATAMTLMARAAGMPARYVEGYSVGEDDYNDVDRVYEVKELNGHAFTEVYIPGYGWKIFDATPSSSEVSEEVAQEKVIEESIEEDIKKVIDYKKILKVIAVTFASVVVLVIGIILFKVTKRPRYLKKVLNMENGKAFEELIKDSIRLLEECDLRVYGGETEIVFAQRVDRNMNLGLKEIVEIYYEYKYGNKKVSKDNVDKALEVNKSIYEFIKS